jgi:superoxide dismutase
MDKAEHAKKVQELHEQLAAVHKELADALRAQSRYESYWIEEIEKNKKLKNEISILKSPEVEITTLTQEKTTTENSGLNK